ncbi:MAG: sugar transferase [Nitrospinae bacterium]|nr:sugar transferase [Nitrospinota bacterium]
MKRVFDLALALALAPLLAVIMVFVALAVKITSPGPVLYFSERVGRHRKHFPMAKVRSMKIDTPQVATHLLADPHNHLTPIGGFLRKTSLDEIPQLWNIIKGDMSFVGPRPALFNQDDLVALREKYGINDLRPGLTGWAQVNGRDELSIPDKVEMDLYYKERQSFPLDIYILFLTFIKAITGHGVKH